MVMASNFGSQEAYHIWRRLHCKIVPDSLKFRHLLENSWAVTQGRLADSPTLGFETESLWDSGRNRADHTDHILMDRSEADACKVQAKATALQTLT